MAGQPSVAGNMLCEGGSWRRRPGVLPGVEAVDGRSLRGDAMRQRQRELTNDKVVNDRGVQGLLCTKKRY